MAPAAGAAASDRDVAGLLLAAERLAVDLLALAGCGEDARPSLEGGPPGAMDDAGIARVAASAELLAMDFYAPAPVPSLPAVLTPREAAGAVAPFLA
jgi:hypothetical protein